MSKKQRIDYITATRDQWAVKALCRVLEVSESGYYKHLRRPDRPHRHDLLLAQIKECITAEPENTCYGVERIFLWLQINRDYKGSKSTIYRICKANNLMIKPKRHPNGITRADAAAQKAENLIQQDFFANAPNEKWLTDITEIPCKDAKLYLSPVLDCFDGQIVSYTMDTNMKAELCVEAFELACRKSRARGMLLHSDRGSQYTSLAFRQALSKRGAIQSMSGVGRCYDNARMESFFATLKKEKLYRMDTKAMTTEEVKTVIARYIAYYNLRRIYTPNGGWPPAVCRQRFYERGHAA